MTTPSVPGSARGRDRSATPWIAPESGERDVRCKLCGSMNRGPAQFCRWCGTPLGLATDPVLGTTTRRAMRRRAGISIGSIFGALVLVVLVVATGWLIFGGGMARFIPAASITPRPSVTATPSGSVGPSGSPGATASPSTVPSPSGSVEPTDSPTPTESVEPSPSPSPSPEPTTLPIKTGFTCDAATIGDPNRAGWQLHGLVWDVSQTTDVMTMFMERKRLGATNQATATVESMLSADVQTRFGVDGPPTSRAIVVTFRGPVTLNDIHITNEPGGTAINTVSTGVGSDGLVHLVIGTQGDGCYKLSADDWGLASPPTTAQVILEVRPH